MRISSQVLSKLDLQSAAKRVVDRPYLDFPVPQAIRCLSDSTVALANAAAASYQLGRSIAHEIITMPKRGFGARPIVIMEPGAQVLYHAIVDLLSPDLPTPSRSSSWSTHESAFVTESDDGEEYVVDFDVVACYEYLDHGVMREELVLRTMSHELPQVLFDLFAEISPRGRGIPQAMEPSHLIADAYLEIIERELARRGFEVRRFADDFRCRAKSWIQANDIVDEATEIARNYGLALSGEKTRIRKISTVRKALADESNVLKESANEVDGMLGVIEYVQVGYDEFEATKIPAPTHEVEVATWGRVLAKFVEEETGGRIYGRFVSSALRELGKQDEYIPGSLLQKIVERDAKKIKGVCQYLNDYDGPADRTTDLARLIEIEKQSAWSKIWLCDAITAEVLRQGVSPGKASHQKIVDWARGMLTDKHELVRNEAAWLLANLEATKGEELSEVFARATDITRPGVAASFGRVVSGGASSTSVANAIKGSSPLARAAFDWGG